MSAKWVMCISRVFGHSHHWRDLLLLWLRESKSCPFQAQNPSLSAPPNYSYKFSENHQCNVLIKSRRWVVSSCAGYWCNISTGSCDSVHTPLRSSALALACLKRGSSLLIVYWCIVCSVPALYASWGWENTNQTQIGLQLNVHWGDIIYRIDHILRHSVVPGSSWHEWWKECLPLEWISHGPPSGDTFSVEGW